MGFVQQHLTSSVGSDPKIVALGLAEAWAGVCGSPENVRKAPRLEVEDERAQRRRDGRQVRLRRPRGLAAARHHAQPQSRRHHVGPAHSRLPRRRVRAEHQHVRRTLVLNRARTRLPATTVKPHKPRRSCRAPGARHHTSLIGDLNTSGRARPRSAPRIRRTSAFSACEPRDTRMPGP